MPEARVHGRRALTAALVAAAVTASAVIGCSDEPTSANAPVVALPLVTLATHDTTVIATGSSTFMQRIATNGATTLVGHAGKYSAVGLIEFLQSGFPDRDTALVFSATLTLKYLSWFGDSSGQLSFNVYRILLPWSSTTATWDTVQEPGFYEQYITRGSFIGGAGLDTQTVTISLDTAMVRQWLATPTTTNTNVKNGILLVPASGCTLIRGFSSSGYPLDSTSWYPTLTIIAGSPSGSPVDTAVYTSSYTTWVGNAENLPTNPQLVYLQSGVDYNATLQFNTAFVPRGAVVNQATLLLTLDPTTSYFNRYATDSSFSLAAITSPSDRTVLDAYGTTSTRVSGSPLTWAIDMTRAVQIWSRNPNYGVTMKPSISLDAISFELMAFFNEQAPPSLRPRLKVKYSIVR
ncbi:MAG TPA: DNRLRE domain-containing protein [Bacteroidota bacterium]|nr:DNRLRE domain-containing protein [Bacteroidota bacterium]